MLNFAPYIDLPLVWGGLIATAICLYVLLDGFDLGVGILFPFAPTDDCRHKMINSIAPFWDGNETWLVLGGGGLFAAFPLAYSLLMPALYIPIILMLLGLIFRGVAFEFRFKAHIGHRYIWDYAFHFGSMITVFCQGLMLGTFVQGIEIEGREFAGGSFDFLTPFSVMTGIALIFGYALLGATWLILKTEKTTQDWGYKSALYILFYVALFMGLVSLWVPFLNNHINHRWFSVPNIYYLSIVPIVTALIFIKLIKAVKQKKEVKPFIYTILLFLLGYLGLVISIWPYIVPYKVTLETAAAAPESQSLLLIGAGIFLPVILGYTFYCYYIFRGKSSHHPIY
ncbi:cytochrome d ubiquinol oxidase subunit II [Rickettsia sibirica]|uniref:Cytochrome d ubiquinol oxidase subunit II n=1 Tax=Rickettsia sibirica (strain ATCC VR-151 / 246) TaxID=272951 RepID=Q7PB28_RICS2|nr:cytochrome d ubiquinol oxidase subunit II [Rickettsia sibirica]EAA25656.1 cytochrome d ubiquinol oxidase subunit II [Rickettsia sibirica 246]